MKFVAIAVSVLLLTAAMPARGESRFTDCQPTAAAPAVPERGARADTTWLFAPSGLGAYGEAGTDARGYTFDGSGECFEAAWTREGGPFPQVRENLYTAGENPSCVWTFFDPGTTEPGYPMGVFPYGPPYYTLSILSPPLELGDDGEPFSLTAAGGQILLSYDVYLDLPLDAVVFQYVEVSGKRPDGDYWVYRNPNYVLYYGQSGWVTHSLDITAALFETLDGEDFPLVGLRVRLGLVDMCADWCGVFGDGYPHTLGALLDRVQVALVRESTAAPATPAPATALASPRPNPFNPATEIVFTLGAAGPARLSICDLAGRRCRVLLDARCPAGEQRLAWDGKDARGAALASGVYLVQLETPTGSWSQKAVLLK